MTVKSKAGRGVLRRSTCFLLFCFFAVSVLCPLFVMLLHLKDAGQLDAAAGEVKTYVMNTQWMCGFPDKLVVASLGGYLVSVFGAEDLVDTFRDKLQTAYPGTQIVSDDPIA